MTSKTFKPITSHPVRCAVIGLGMGQHHAAGIMECGQGELVAAVDMSQERLAFLKEKSPQTQLFTDYREMLRSVRPELVVIALPNSLHESVTLDALDAGANVLCEKPAAMTVGQAESMRDAALGAGLQLGINFSQRFAPAHRALKAIADAGKLGDIYHAYCSWLRREGFPGFGGWFGQRSLSGGGPLIDLGVHRLDLALWLMGYPQVVSVSGVAHRRIGVPRALKQNLPFDVEDFASGIVRFDNGASLVFEVSWAGHLRSEGTQQMRVLGTEGALEQSDGEYAHHFQYHGAYCSTRIDAGKAVPGSSVQEMIRCLVDGVPFGATIEQGITVQRILNGLYLSAEQGREVIFSN